MMYIPHCARYVNLLGTGHGPMSGTPALREQPWKCPRYCCCCSISIFIRYLDIICIYNLYMCVIYIYIQYICTQMYDLWYVNPPAPKVLGRDLPDGTRKRLQVYLGGGGIFRPKPPVFDRSWRSPSKNVVKNSTEDTCSWTRPSKIGKRKVKKPSVFQLFDLNFLVCNIFFCGSAGGLARRRIFEFLDPFSDWFSSSCDSRNTGFYSVFLFSACLKLPKTS